MAARPHTHGGRVYARGLDEDEDAEESAFSGNPEE
jgi:hypothetical protein